MNSYLRQLKEGLVDIHQLKGIHNKFEPKKGLVVKAKKHEYIVSEPSKFEKKQERRLEWTDLMTASSNGDVEWANKLLKEDVDIDRQDADGLTPLMVASREGKTEMVALLLSKGAQANLQKRGGKSALMLASKRGHTEVVSLLLNSDADVNMQKKPGSQL